MEFFSAVAEALLSTLAPAELVVLYSVSLAKLPDSGEGRIGGCLITVGMPPTHPNSQIIRRTCPAVTEELKKKLRFPPIRTESNAKFLTLKSERSSS
jgi:hypothetical protein